MKVKLAKTTGKTANKAKRAKPMKLADEMVTAIKAMPKIRNMNKRGSRSMYSLADKKSLAEWVVKNNMSVKLTSVLQPHVSTGQLYSWLRDYRAGIYDMQHAVCVSRG